MIRASARRFAQLPLLFDANGCLTYAQARTEVARIRQRWARDLDLRPQEPVGLVAGTTRGDVLALLAAWEHPGRLFLVHPRAPQRERQRLADRAGFRWLTPPAPSAPPAPSGGNADPDALPEAGPDKQVAFFTSGSTGAPKAVLLDGACLAAAARASAANLGWHGADRWLLSIPVAHVGGFSILSRCLAAGRPVVLPEPCGFDVEGFWSDVDRHRVTLASVVPTMLGRLLRAPRDPGTLRALLVGGAATPATALHAAAELGWPVLTTYGLTEAAAQVVTQPFGTRPDPGWGAGRPLAGVRVRVDGAGRIWLLGPSLFRGYVEEPPRRPEDWFDTGDRGELRDGRLFVRGRGSQMIVSGGENVFPAEVEAVLMEHPAVAQAVVVGVPDNEWGERVEALIVASHVPADLQVFLRERLASFKVPKSIRAVSSLPSTPLGKPDRVRARQLCTDD